MQFEISVIRKILDLRICCDIQLEKKKKFKVKFKFKDAEKTCKYFDPFERFFEISRRMKKKFMIEKLKLFEKKLKKKSKINQEISEKYQSEEFKLEENKEQIVMNDLFSMRLGNVSSNDNV